MSYLEHFKLDEQPFQLTPEAQQQSQLLFQQQQLIAERMRQIEEQMSLQKQGGLKDNERDELWAAQENNLRKQEQDDIESLIVTKPKEAVP